MPGYRKWTPTKRTASSRRELKTASSQFMSAKRSQSWFTTRPLLISLHKGVAHGSSRAKYVAAFLRTSRSSVTSGSWRLRRWISVCSSVRVLPLPGNETSGPCVASSFFHRWMTERFIPNINAKDVPLTLPSSNCRTASILNSRRCAGAWHRSTWLRAWIYPRDTSFKYCLLL